MDPNNLPGPLKVAILIQSLDNKTAQETLNSLDDREKGLVQGHLSQMGMISPDVVEKVAAEFASIATPKRTKGASKTGKSEEDAGSITKSSDLKTLQSLQPEQITDLVRDEHPQTIAIILVHLKTEVASAVLAGLADEVKADVALRIANLDKVQSGMVEEVDRVFESVLQNKKSSVTHKTGGINCLAELLKKLDATTGDLILTDIEDSDPDLADQIKGMLFLFEDLTLVDDRDLQKILRSIDTRELAMGLKAASDEVRDKVLRNLSERASEMLSEEIEALGAVRMKDVEDAQGTIIKIIQDMEQKGEIVISGRGGEEFVE
jgi:flagellar motor switch protein FliG